MPVSATGSKTINRSESVSFRDREPFFNRRLKYHLDFNTHSNRIAVYFHPPGADDSFNIRDMVLLDSVGIKFFHAENRILLEGKTFLSVKGGLENDST